MRVVAFCAADSTTDPSAQFRYDKVRSREITNDSGSASRFELPAG
jgi:hypothetical protein